MRADVIDLRDFYASPLGELARRQISRHVRALWPNVRGERILGLGFAGPYLDVFAEEAERTLAVMPPSQGIMRWPAQGTNRAVLADETELPFPDCSIDRILLVHGLEGLEQTTAAFRELWRVLTDAGRLLIVVPNRRGLWSRLERSPFACGRPYSSGQLEAVLRANLFAPEARGATLLTPPFQSAMVQSLAPVIERIGSRWCPGVAGVLVTEAGKQIHALPLSRELRPARSRESVVALPGLRPGAVAAQRRTEPPPMAQPPRPVR
ncbi:class I SAM-dependent methyltransferase [Roseospira marina]|uniref:Class I SAM-dependent methyltransferase n=1 Tax=Roseospira marina TaxID=140057 RepID=A0A5M6I7Z8_9PROT|nr:methyltransferase domain-containing protein [Roseospira marina]KAA5604293.1 class I SAM-dependent methyltransferase [Roseospira marina]MBB4315684.1 SAM-dependent methyltransferase [Roseospira marina]MBB5088742.1 SAM-dependent methyltransferase [Roseospira marina]